MLKIDVYFLEHGNIALQSRKLDLTPAEAETTSTYKIERRLYIKLTSSSYWIKQNVFEALLLRTYSSSPITKENVTLYLPPHSRKLGASPQCLTLQLSGTKVFVWFAFRGHLNG